MELIDKDAVEAEIKERIKTYNKGYANGDDRRADALEVLLHDIDTLEVKEVDFESEQRMRDCPYRQVVCTMYGDKILECNGACSWVVDYPKLKEFKARKRE